MQLCVGHCKEEKRKTWRLSAFYIEELEVNPSFPQRWQTYTKHENLVRGLLQLQVTA